MPNRWGCSVNKNAKAKELLVWYFQLAASGGLGFSSDNQAEIENIIELTIDAAVKEATAKLLPRIEALEAQINGGVA